MHLECVCTADVVIGYWGTGTLGSCADELFVIASDAAMQELARPQDVNSTRPNTHCHIIQTLAATAAAALHVFCMRRHTFVCGVQ